MNFTEFYNELKKGFINDNSFVELIGKNQKINWPKGSGVYVVWKNDINDAKNLLYVGMTGKFSRTKNGKIDFNKAQLKSRVNRWTPYRFAESEKDSKFKYFFRYGPKLSSTNEQKNIMFDNDAYKESVSYSELILHCFLVSENHKEYSPTLLESLILNKYLKLFNNDLPPANNSL
jgi:regulatory protein YycI of two-component signal transduction system YycFG